MNRLDLELDPDLLELIEQDGLARWIKPLGALSESPEQMLQKIRDDYKHIAPNFLVIIEQCLVDPERLQPQEIDYLNYGLCFAAEFCDTRFSEFFLKIARYESESLDDLFGEFIAGDFKDWFASICGHDLEGIKEFILDTTADYFARWSAVDSFQYLLARGIYSEEHLKNELRDIIAQMTDGEDSIWDPISGLIIDLGWVEFEPVITDAWQRHQLDPSINGDLDEILAGLRKHARHGRDDARFKEPYDAVHTIEHWWKIVHGGPPPDADTETDPPFTLDREVTLKPLAPALPPAGYSKDFAGSLVREQAKVGRNDPCSCGSGKKFKKCCG